MKKSKLEERLDGTLVELMMDELDTLDKLEHPHVVGVLDLLEDKSHIYIVLELMPNGNLTEVLAKIEKAQKINKFSFTETNASNLVHQLLLAINFLHGKGICHRDMKLDNIMVTIERNEVGKCTIICKVTDFGFAKAIDPSEKESMSLGTPLYMAPELACHEPYSFEVDIWALGVITHNILLGKPPFLGKDKPETFEKIVNQELDLEPLSKFENNGELVKDFLTKCL